MYQSENKGDKAKVPANNSSLHYLQDNRKNRVAQLQKTIQFGDKWKTKGTDKDIKSEQKLASDQKEVDTAHHILPKGKLVTAHAKLSKSEQEKIGMAVGGKKEVLSDKQLKSLQFNLTLGPRPEERTDDPGDKLDPNMAKGAMTPRSSALSKAWDSTKEDIDHTKLVKAIEEAHTAHKVSPKMDRSKWKKVGAKYKRDDT